MNKIFKALWYGLLALGIAGVLGTCTMALTDSVQSDKEQRKLLDQREWKTTPLGVKYFEECVDGDLFYMTHSSHGNIHMAGPVRACE